MIEHFLTVDDGARVHAVEEGAADGRPVLLLHDLDCSWQYWLEVMQRLLARQPALRLVALDLRGHGASSSAEEPSRKRLVRDVKRVCRQLSLEEPVLVGHGWGADVVMACEFAGSVVAINPLMGRDSGTFPSDVPRPPGLAGAADAQLLERARIGATSAKPLRRSKRDAPLFLVYADPADSEAVMGSDALEVAWDVLAWQSASRHLPLEMPDGVAAILLSWIEEVA